MKKIIASLLCVIAIVTSFVGCNSTEDDITTTVQPTTTTEQTTKDETTTTTEVETTQKPKVNETTTKKPKPTTERQTTTEKKTTEKSEENASGDYYTIRCKITHYCPCATCNGSSSGLTAMGTRLKPYYTVAVDRSVIPLGSKVEINGKTYRAEDTGVSGHTIDMCVNSHSEAYQKGVYYATVKVFRK